MTIAAKITQGTSDDRFRVTGGGIDSSGTEVETAVSGGRGAAAFFFASPVRLAAASRNTYANWLPVWNRSSARLAIARLRNDASGTGTRSWFRAGSLGSS